MTVLKQQHVSACDGHHQVALGETQEINSKFMRARGVEISTYGP